MRELITCVLMLAASPALADPETTLLLRDHMTVEGHVLRMEQGRRVVVRVDDGTVRIVPWEQIADITGVAAYTLPQVDEWEPPARPLPQPGWVPLTLQADGASVNVGPSASDGRRSRMQSMCATPCTYYVLPGTVRVQTSNGERELKLEVPPGGLDATIHPASTGYSLFGIMLWMIGAPVMVGGAIVLPRHGDLKVGATMLGIGTAMTTAGITLAVLARPRVLSQHPHVSQLSFGVSPARGGGAAQLQARF